MTAYLYFLSGIYTLIACLLMAYNWKYNKNILFISLFLVLTALEFVMINILHFETNQFASNFIMLVITSLLIKAPTLYFYIRGIVFDNFILKKLDILHFIPFGLLLLFNVILLFSFSDNKNITNLLFNYQAETYEKINFLYETITWSYVIVSIQLFVYVIWSFILLNQNQKVSTKMYAQYKYQYRYIIQKIYFVVFILFIISGLDLVYKLIYLFKENNLLLMCILLCAYSLIPLFFFVTPKLLYGLPHVETTHISATNLDKLKEGADGT